MGYTNVQHSRWQRSGKDGDLLEKRVKVTTRITSFPLGSEVNGKVRILVLKKTKSKIALDIEFSLQDLPFSSSLMVKNRWVLLEGSEVGETLVHNSMKAQVENSTFLENYIREKARAGMNDLVNSWFRLADD